MENVAGQYIVRGIIGKLCTFLDWDLPWPAHPCCRIDNWKNVHFDVSSVRVFQMSGSQFGASKDANITIGKNCYIARNVGIFTANHLWHDLDKMTPGEDVVIGDYCWIGMNVVILPGVILGPHTVVGAGAVVTKSFVDGNCVIGGNPARRLHG